MVKRCSKLRALGARHSFNGIADSTENQISLAHLNQIALNRESRPPYGKHGSGLAMCLSVSTTYSCFVIHISRHQQPAPDDSVRI